MKRLRFLLAALFLSVTAAFPQLQIVASNTLLQDLTRQIALPEDAVTSLLPRGADPHGYQPAPKEIARLHQADIIIVNGLGLEPWLERTTKDLDRSGSKVVHAAKGINPLYSEHVCGDHDHAHHDHEDQVDPHGWHDLQNVAIYVANIRDALAAEAPALADAYNARARALIDHIQNLDTEARRRMASIPAENRRMVTSHESFAYFGRAYGIEVIPVSGLRPDREPSAKELAALSDRIRSLRVRAVFVESTSNPKIPRVLAEEAGVRVVTELFTDSLGPEGGKAGTFLGMFRANLDTIEQSLKD